MKEGKKKEKEVFYSLSSVFSLMGRKSAAEEGRQRPRGCRKCRVQSLDPTGWCPWVPRQGQGELALWQPVVSSQRDRTATPGVLSLLFPLCSSLLPLGNPHQAETRAAPKGSSCRSSHFACSWPLVWALTPQHPGGTMYQLHWPMEGIMTKQPENVNDDTCQREITSKWQTWLPLGPKNRDFVQGSLAHNSKICELIFQ